MLDVNATKGSTGGVVQNAGNGDPHNTVHPVLALNWFVKY